MAESQTLLQRLSEREDNGDGIYPLFQDERVDLAFATRWLTWGFGVGANYVPFGTGPGCYSVGAYVSFGPWSLSLDVKVADLLSDLCARRGA